jgi:phosphoribosylcarboxyaminoimidazole (NCAIR) mutase
MIAKPKIVIIAGSESDMGVFDEAKVAAILDDILGVGNWVVDICSAHRNPDALLGGVDHYAKRGIKVFIALMGLKPALPDAILEVVPEATVIAVPLRARGTSCRACDAAGRVLCPQCRLEQAGPAECGRCRMQDHRRPRSSC